MARGWFPLSHDLLRDVLSLPDDAEIVGVEYISPLICKVWVVHKDIPESKEGAAMELLPVLHREGEQVTMIKWGIHDTKRYWNNDKSNRNAGT